MASNSKGLPSPFLQHSLDAIEQRDREFNARTLALKQVPNRTRPLLVISNQQIPIITRNFPIRHPKAETTGGASRLPGSGPVAGRSFFDLTKPVLDGGKS